MHRKHRRAAEGAEAAEEETGPSVEWNAPLDVWTRERVEKAVLELPEPIRAVVVLVLIEDLTYEEAAKVLGCPLGTEALVQDPGLFFLGPAGSVCAETRNAN